MNEQAMKFRLGVFVLAAAILLGVLTVLFGEFPALFSNQFTYQVTFDQATGVEVGTPVRKSGIKIGEVTGIDLNPDSGKVTLAIVVEGKYQLRRGDKPELYRGLVLGEASVNFSLDGDRRPAPDGHTFTGLPSADVFGKAADSIPAALDQFRATAKAVQDFVPKLGQTNEEIRRTFKTINDDFVPRVTQTNDEIRKAVKSINDFVPELRDSNKELQVALKNVGKAAERVDVLLEGNQKKIGDAIDRFIDVANRTALLLSDENQKNLATALKNIRTASDSFDSLIKGSEQLLVDTRKTVKTIGEKVESVGQGAEDLLKESKITIKKVNDALTKSDEVLANIQQATKPFAEKAGIVMKNLEEGTGKLNLIASDVREFTKALVQGDGTLRRFVSDPTLYNSLNDGITSLSKSMARIDRVLRDLEVFADKIARHPELLGVGGAVSPSSGLKRAP